MQRRHFIAAAAGAFALATAGSVQAEDLFLKMDSFPPGTSPGQFGIAFTQVVQKHMPVTIQVSAGKPATKSAIDAAKKNVDLFLTAPTINHFMQTKSAMYKKVADADKLNANLRGLVNYALGPYHIIVYADSGITSLKEIKGKKVFLGPPAGAATKVTTQIVAGATGFEPGKDFEVMRFDWKTAETAFIDRQMEVYMGPTTVPSPQIQQFALVSPIRFLGIPAEAFDTAPMKAALGLPGRTIHDIPPGIYKNQVNDAPVRTIGSWVGLGTHKWLDEQVVYDMTKAFWENIDEVYATAEWMKAITKESALKEMNIPLHVGAYRYYKEAGFAVPDHVVPPEAK